MLYENTKISELDIVVILVMILLVAAGLISIYSAVHTSGSSELQANFFRQIVWFAVGIFFFVCTTFLSIRVISDVSYWIYFFTLILLASTLFAGSGAGVQRWLAIGPVQFQPAEFCKIGVVLALAKYLSAEKRDMNRPSHILIAGLIVLLPVLLLLKQPDLGTALVFISLILPVIFWAGLPLHLMAILLAPCISMIASFHYYSFFAAMIFIALVFALFRRGLKFLLGNMVVNVAVAVTTPFLWNALHAYQKHRILTFLGLELDVHGSGYQLIQSKVAIGSGGFLGKGFLEGTQTQLRFLPAQHTDFIFSVIGEEFGFIGIFLIFLFFYFIIIRGIHVAYNCRNKFSSLMSTGAAGVIALHVIINTGMTVGVMPVTGIPLPLISYGGSSLVTNMILIALIINASMRRYNI